MALPVRITLNMYQVGHFWWVSLTIEVGMRLDLTLCALQVPGRLEDPSVLGPARGRGISHRHPLHRDVPRLPEPAHAAGGRLHDFADQRVSDQLAGT